MGNEIQDRGGRSLRAALSRLRRLAPAGLALFKVPPPAEVPNVVNSAARNRKLVSETLACSTVSTSQDEPRLVLRKFGTRMGFTLQCIAMQVSMVKVFASAHPFKVVSTAVFSNSIKVSNLLMKGIGLLPDKCAANQSMKRHGLTAPVFAEHDDRVIIAVRNDSYWPGRVEVEGSDLSKIRDFVKPFIVGQRLPQFKHKYKLAVISLFSIAIAKEN